MLDKILILIAKHSDIEFWYKKNHLIKYWDWYEINTKNALLNFKNLYLELFYSDLIFIAVKDFEASNTILRKIINKHKIGLFGRYTYKINMFRKTFFDTKALFYDKEFLNYFDEHQAFLDFNLFIFTPQNFLYKLFEIVEEELWKWEENEDIVGEKLFLEIDNTLKWKSTYSKEIEIAFIVNKFIKWENRYIYFLLKELEDNHHLKIKKITIKESKIKFIITDLTEINRDLFTNLEEKEETIVTEERKMYSEYVNDKLTIYWSLIKWNSTSKPWELIKLFYKLKKTWEYSVSYSLMRMYIINNPLEFSKISSTHFSEWQIREILRKKNEQIWNINELKPILSWDFFISEDKGLKIQK